MIDRRTFLASVPAAFALSQGRAAEADKRLKLAALTTIYHKYSHSEHIVDRFLEGYGWNGRFYKPNVDVVSMFVEQVGENDLSRERASRHPKTKIYPTIAEALTCGGNKLAVDGVLLIGEHGKYPNNEKGQKLYPRYQYFTQIVDVFRRTGQTAPVFNDKHLSWKWEWAKEMYDTSKRMGFGLMAGSSLPVTWRIPSQDLPLGAEVKEAVAVYGGGIDGGDIHGIEAMQALIERRQGGETGVAALDAKKGNHFWEAFRAKSWEEGGSDPELFEACLSRSHSLAPAREGFNHIYPTFEQIPGLVRRPYRYRFEYRDGLRVTMLAMGGLSRGTSLAVRLKNGDILSTQIYLPYDTLRNFFSPLCHHIETFFRTGISPYPVERTLLTTGLTAAGADAIFQGGVRLETPHLAIAYQPSKESTFWRS